MEFERQNALLEEMEREESNMTRMEMEAEQARREEEERLAQGKFSSLFPLLVLGRARLNYPLRISRARAPAGRGGASHTGGVHSREHLISTSQYFTVWPPFSDPCCAPQEQAERTRAAEAKWRREEEARQDAAQALYQEQIQKEQRRQEAEQRRQAEQQRQAEAQRQTELLKARMGGPPAGHQLYDAPLPGSDASEVLSPTPMSPNHRRLDSRGSFSSSPTPSDPRQTSSPPFGCTPFPSLSPTVSSC